jgi:hypothetical protein
MSPPAATFFFMTYMAGSRFLARKSMIHPIWDRWKGSAVIINPSGRY